MRAGEFKNSLRATKEFVEHRIRPARPGGSHLVVLTFHRFGSPDVVAPELRRLRQVATPVSLDDVLAANAGGDPLPRGAVLVTIDDGHPSVMQVASVFAELAVPAVCFVVSDLIDTNTPFWWDEVVALTAQGATAEGCHGRGGMDLVNDLKRVPDAGRRAVLAELRTQVNAPVEVQQITHGDLGVLQDAGIAIGGHSASHPILTRCDDEVLAHEVRSCRERLTELLGSAPRSFAYPGGGVDDRVVAATELAGWEVAFAWDHRVSDFPFPNLHQISRVKANLGSGRSRMALMATGRHHSLTPTP